MNKNNILEGVGDICRSVFNDANLIVTQETSARDVANWDSLTNLILIDALESHFSIKFSLDEILEAQNIGDLCQIILEKKDSNEVQ